MGWNARWGERWRALNAPDTEPGRVLRHDGPQYLVETEGGPVAAVLPGRWRQDKGLDVPAVGDWVAVAPESGLARIEAVLPRATWIAREAAGSRTERQVVAANVDYALVVTDGGADFNARRIERYVTALGAGGGVQPVIVVNKADQVADRADVRRDLERAAPGVAAILLSAQSGEGVDELTPYLAVGATLACVGSSGVGKSTLINRLLGHASQATGEVREHDGRGRHTTTHRELLALPGGAVIIDTPGLRELVPWFEPGTTPGGFADIAELARGCRYRDCRHVDEPGCAVLAAVQAGTLDAERHANLQQLEREAAFQESRRNDTAARTRKRTERTLGRTVRDMDKRHPKRR